MASSGLGDAPLAPLEHDATYQICHKCKKVLPIHHYTKDGRCLKTCFECRDRHQIKKRAGRRRLAEVNAQLRNSPVLNRTFVENTCREAYATMQLSSNLPNIGTTTLSSTTKSNRPFTSCPVPTPTLAYEPVTPVTEEEVSPIHGKSAILATTEMMRKGLDTIISLVNKGSCSSSCRSPTNPSSSTSPSSHVSAESTGNSIKSESQSSKYEPSDDGGSEISGPSHFICMHCMKPRSIGLRYDDICVYCFEKKQQFCVDGDHEMDQNEFFDEDGNEYDVCNDCRVEMVKMEDEIE